MNPSLICTTLATLSPVGPAVPVNPVAWSNSGSSDGDNQAFSRALSDARQAANNDGARPAPPAHEDEGRAEGARTQRSEQVRPRSERSRDGTEGAPRHRSATAARQGQAPARRDGTHGANETAPHDQAAKARGRPGAGADDEGTGADGSVRGRAKSERAGEAGAADAQALAGVEAAVASAGEPGEASTHLARHGATHSDFVHADAATTAAPGSSAGMRAGWRSGDGGAVVGVSREDGATATGRARGHTAAARGGAAIGAGAAELRAMFADTAAAAAAASAATANVAGEAHHERAGDAAPAASRATSLLPADALFGPAPAAANTVAPLAGTQREARLSSPPGSESFARELGAQVSLFVREGVQQARLHLNPQELGPVLVRIQLEGQAAQVHWAAEQQPTRQALEQALPTLASQLSDAGITLAGGGVFERPTPDFGAGSHDESGARGPAAGSGMRADGAERAGGAAAEPARWSRPRGIVDLIA